MLLGQQNIRGNQLTSARTTVGTYIGADGLLHVAQPFVLRPNYVLQNGVWVQQGFLREGATTNYEFGDFVSAISVQSGVYTSAAGITGIANRLWNTGNGNIITLPIVKTSLTAATNYIFSFFVQFQPSSYFSTPILINSWGFSGAVDGVPTITLTTDANLNAYYSVTNATLQNYTNNWARISFRVTSGTVISWHTNNQNNIVHQTMFDGLQIEDCPSSVAGSTSLNPSSYINAFSATSPVTRTAD